MEFFKIIWRVWQFYWASHSGAILIIDVSEHRVDDFYRDTCAQHVGDGVKHALHSAIENDILIANCGGGEKK